jgi:DNA-binding MltR family transcriptional regulator
LYALIFEVRENKEGEYYDLVTLWKATKQEQQLYVFTNSGHMMGPIQRVNVDFASPMLDELDNAAKELNISRQAVIKTLIRHALDQHYLATARQPAAKQR